MSKFVVIESSPRGPASVSNQMSERLIQALAGNAQAEVVCRNVAEEPVPVLDGEVLGAFFTSWEDRTATQHLLSDRSEKLIKEVKTSDTLVIAASMYNFTIPAQLKSYFDMVLRAGHTFKYTANGPEGLVKGKRAVILAATGGVYSSGPAAAADFMVPYIKQVLAFIGITDVTVIRAEGMALGPDAAKAGLDKAFAEIDAYVKGLPIAA